MNDLDTVEAEYRLSLFNKIFYSLLAAGFLFFVVFIISNGPFKHPADAWIVLPPITAFAILLLVNLRRKVIISSNIIKNVGLFTTKELPLTAVKGMRLPSKGIVLEPVSSEYATIVIGNYFDLTNSDSLLEWARTNFPDLDAADLEKAKQQLLQDEPTGDAAPGRQRMIDRARTIVPVYNTLAGIVAFFCILFNGKFSSVLLLLIPLAGIFLLFTHKGLIKFFSVSNRSIYPAVFWGILLSSFFLLVHTVFYYNLLQWQNLLLPTSIITVFTGSLLYKKGINPTAGELKGQIFFMAVVSMAYGIGSTRLLNCAFDHSKETAYPAVLQERFISSARSSKSYYFVLAPWGPKHSSAQVEVGRLLYRVQKAGDTVTVQLKQGLLEAPWYWVEKRADNLITEKEKN